MPDVLAGVENERDRTSSDPAGVDVVTYWCPIHRNIWTSIVVNQVEVADTKIATLLPS